MRAQPQKAKKMLLQKTGYFPQRTEIYSPFSFSSLKTEGEE